MYGICRVRDGKEKVPADFYSRYSGMGNFGKLIFKHLGMCIIPMPYMENNNFVFTLKNFIYSPILAYSYPVIRISIH